MVEEQEQHDMVTADDYPLELPVVLTKEQIEEYFSKTSDESYAQLAEALELPGYRSDARSAIRLDFATYAMEFAKEAGFGPVRTASLLRVAQNLLEAAAGGATASEALATFKAHMLKLTSPKPGNNSPLFSPDQVAQVARFLARTFFQHYRLYSHVFSTEQEVTECTASLTVETAVFPSFEGALPEEEWFAKLAEEKAAAEAAVAAAAAEAEAATARAAAEAKAAAAAAEEARRQEELAKKPATLEEAIEHLVAVRLEEEKKVLAAEYAAKEDVLLKKILDLEAQAAAAAASRPESAATVSAKGKK